MYHYCRRSGNDEVMQLSGLPDLSLRWLNRALGTSVATDSTAETVEGPAPDGHPAALQMVMGCFPSVTPGSVASATYTERELLLELMRHHMSRDGSIAHGVSEHDSAQVSTAAVMQLAVAALSYCSTDLQTQVRSQALLPTSTGCWRVHLESTCVVGVGR